jgi:hypothetical protein
LSDWEEKLNEQEARQWKNYHKFRIALSAGRNNMVYNFPGDFLYVVATSTASAAATIKLNKNTNEDLDLKAGTKIKTVFTHFYFTNEAQAGEWMDLIIGIDFEKDDEQPQPAREAQPVIEITHANPNTNQAGASLIADRVVITADPQNTDLAWIDFGQAAVQNGCYPMEPGDSVTVRISNIDQINVNFEVGGESVWIIREI